jgi:hypothetical protein
MSKLYLARHKIYDVYWGRKHGIDMWTKDISSALLMTKEQWKYLFRTNDNMKNLVQLYERRYCND